MANRINLATLFGIGLAKKAPGTAGSAAAALLAYFILPLPFSMILLTCGTFLFTIWGTRSTTRYMQSQSTAHDPKEVVIDELVGQWLTYVIGFQLLRVLECGAGGPCGSHFLTMFPNLTLAVILGFALFRVFDILKPWPISWADRKVKGGFGVMLDDLLAAIPAGILLAILYPMLVMFFV